VGLTAVHVGLGQNRHMTIAAVLPQGGGHLPQPGQVVGHRQVSVGREEGPASSFTVLDGPQQLGKQAGKSRLCSGRQSAQSGSR
jgi:hypothetical protein